MRTLNMRKSCLVLALAVALLATGCAATQTQQGLVVSGQSLIGVGNTFVAVGASYTANCLPSPKDAKLAAFCSGFKQFAPKFQTAYPQAVDAWEVARKANDASKAQDATAVILQLSADLTALAIQALGSVR